MVRRSSFSGVWSLIVASWQPTRNSCTSSRSVTTPSSSETGWACSYKLLPDGGRQVIDFPIPGDIIGLRSVLLHASDHSFATITDVTVAEISARQLVEAFERQPRLGVAMLWAVSRDEAMVVEHLVNCGRRSAMVRIAHFLVELGLRLQLAGLGSETQFACPLNQYLLADAVGLTAIHVNRILRQLRERGLVDISRWPGDLPRPIPIAPSRRPPARADATACRSELTICGRLSGCKVQRPDAAMYTATSDRVSGIIWAI